MLVVPATDCGGGRPVSERKGEQAVRVGRVRGDGAVVCELK